MRKYLKRFTDEETGAVTVDWVVLTALVIGMSVGLMLLLNNEERHLASELADYISKQGGESEGD